MKNWTEDSWVYIYEDISLRRLKTPAAISMTLKHYPKMGRKGFLFIANASKDREYNIDKYRKALKKEKLFFDKSLTAYNADDKVMENLFPLFVETKDPKILKRLKFEPSARARVSRNELLDI